MDITEQMILRLVDANINRLREGLRVSEDICRFVLNDAALSRQFKALRHQAKQAGDMIAPCPQLLKARDAQSDVGATIANKDENQREDIQRILAANMKRTQGGTVKGVESIGQYDCTVVVTGAVDIISDSNRIRWVALLPWKAIMSAQRAYEAERYRHEKNADDEDACTMCGRFCAMKLVSEYLT